MQKAKTQEAIKPQQLVTITFPEAGKTRSRKVVTRSRARATGKFPSRKMNRMLQWESINELNAFRLVIDRRNGATGSMGLANGGR